MDVLDRSISYRGPDPTMTTNELLVDKCSVCNTYFVVGSSADLQRRINAHELEEHGKVRPTRIDHDAADYQ